MKPVRIKVYGLFSMTRKGYLLLQAACFVVLGSLLLGTHLAGDALDAETARKVASALKVLFAVIILAEIIETLIMLKKFRAAERTLAASSDESAYTLAR